MRSGAGYGGLRGAIRRGVARLGHGRRFGGLVEVGEQAPDLSFVAQHGHEAKAPVALWTIENIEVVAPAQ